MQERQKFGFYMSESDTRCSCMIILTIDRPCWSGTALAGVQSDCDLVVKPEVYSSRPQSSLLLCLSSLASLLFRPHFFLTCSKAAFCRSSLSFGARQTMPMKNCEQSNFSANLFCVHLSGSSVRNLLISAISFSRRWYFFSGSWRMEGGRPREGSL